MSTTASSTYTGTSGSDTYTGQTGNDVIYGLAGDDNLTGNGGADTIYGGQGNDTIDISASTTSNSTGVAYISGDLGNDVITGGAISETILGGGGNDQITVAAGAARTNEALFGNTGNDTISATSAGGETLYGGQDQDTLVVHGTAADGVLHWGFGNLGNDTIYVNGSAGSIFGGQGNDVIHADATTATNAGANPPVAGSLTADGSAAIAQAASTAHNFLSGDLGNDTIFAGNGGDTLVGGAGADSIIGGGGNDIFVIHANDSVAVADSSNTSGNTTTTVNGQANLDHFAQFTRGSDVITIAGHNALINSGDATATSPQNVVINTITGSANTTTDYEAAYTYAYGNSSTGQLGAFSPGAEYVEVHSTNGGVTYLFTNDTSHTAVVINGVGNLLTGDVVAGS